METPLLKSEKKMSFDDFTDHIYVLLNSAWGDEWGVFTETSPTSTDSKNSVFPQIVYELKSMVPGRIGKNTREIKPRFREEITIDGQKTRFLGQIMDCKVGFYIYGTSNEETELLTNRFMELLDTFKGYLGEQGLKELIFENRTKLLDTSNTKETTSTRYLEYFLRLENITQQNVDSIKTISLEAKSLYETLAQQNKLPSQKK